LAKQNIVTKGQKMAQILNGTAPM